MWGGQVHIGETFVEAVQLQMIEEFGIEVDVLYPFCTYCIDLENKIIPGIRFICKPKARQEVHIDNKEIVQYRWASIEKLSNINMIPGLKEDILLGYKFYNKME